MHSLAHLEDDELLRSLHAAVSAQRNATAAIVAHLAEVEERRLHLRRAFPSMFQYCVEELAFSEDEACRRIEAARLARRHPQIVPMLDAGQLSLSVTCLLKEHLTKENAAELLAGVSGCSARRAREWLAARFPRVDVPESVRKLPPPKDKPVLPCINHAAPEPQNGSRAAEVTRASVEGTTSTAASAIRQAAAASPGHRARVEPLSQDRFVVRLTIGRAARDKLELARALARHRRPDGSLELLFEDALDALLVQLERAKLRATTRSPPTRRASRPATITSATRREVAARDGARCSFVAPDGRRCESQAFLEFDHVEPAALGGGGEPSNVRLLCRAHNQLAAERVYGRALMDRARANSPRHPRQSQATAPAPAPRPTRDSRG